MRFGALGGRESRIEDENEMQAEPPALWAAEEGARQPPPKQASGGKGTSAGLNKLHAGREFAFGVMFEVPSICMFWGQECFLRFGSLQISLVAEHL